MFTVLILGPEDQTLGHERVLRLLNRGLQSENLFSCFSRTLRSQNFYQVSLKVHTIEQGK